MEQALQRALAIRLNLQISLSSQKFVAEWMDIHLDRWIDNLPLPPEMPRDHDVSFLASLGVGMNRLWWGAYGHPAGFIPKMSSYFKLCNMSRADESLIDGVGNELEPSLVGSWVAVRNNQIVTGWHFWDEHPFAKLEPIFGDHDAKRALVAWLGENKISTFRRFTQGIKDHAFTEIEFAVPGVAIDDQIAAVSAAFERFGAPALTPSIVQAMSGAVSPGFGFSLRIAQGQVVRVAAHAPSMGNDVIAELCTAIGTPFDPQVVKVMNTMGAEAAERVELSSEPNQGFDIDIEIVPSETKPKPTSGKN